MQNGRGDMMNCRDWKIGWRRFGREGLAGICGYFWMEGMERERGGMDLRVGKRKV